MTELRITGWRTGLKKISMTDLLHTKAGLTIAAAKDATDRVLEGQLVNVSCDSPDEAASLASALIELGADIQIQD